MKTSQLSYFSMPFSVSNFLYSLKSVKTVNTYLQYLTTLVKTIALYGCKCCGDHSSKNTRCGCRTAATSKVELFVILVNGFQPLTIITKSSALEVPAVLDSPLNTYK